jgi:alginate O-acetyltransferase complex protein AlgI
LYLLRSYAITFVLLIVSSGPWGKNLWARLPQRAQQVLTPVLMGASLIIGTAYLVDGSYNPFLYFRF